MNRSILFFERSTKSALYQLKRNISSTVPHVIPFQVDGKFCGHLRVISACNLKNLHEVKLLARWRKVSNQWFPAVFPVTIDGTKRWSKNLLLEKEDRILFMVEDLTHAPLGHVGLNRFQFSDYSCEIDNIIRGESGVPGVMTVAILTLMSWGKTYLGLRSYSLEVFSDNTRAIALYTRCGFRESKRVPLKKVTKKERIIWVESKQEKQPSRYNVYMSTNL